MSRNSQETLNPMSNNLPPPPDRDERVLKTRPVALIPFVGLRLLLDQNPQALVFATIVGVRIHERGLLRNSWEALNPMSNSSKTPLRDNKIVL
jgi:hypothetical protein